MAKQLPMHFYRSPAPFSRLQLATGQTEIAGVHPGPSKTFSLLLIGLSGCRYFTTRIGKRHLYCNRIPTKCII
jgi:hypothetical protein